MPTPHPDSNDQPGTPISRKWTADSPINYEKSTLAELLNAKFPPSDWIVKGLIHAGDQVVLAGPPKVGKSILGTQLALAVAQGNATSFLSKAYVSERAQRRVLVFSLEMNAPMVAERLRVLFPKQSKAPPKRSAPEQIPVTFVFEAERSVSLDIVNFSASFESKARKAGTPYLTEEGYLLKEIIRRENPDLVIFDTLIRIHALDENNNVAMSHLLRQLREICRIDERKFVDAVSDSTETERVRRKIAHVVIHHTRKESAGVAWSGNKDANAVRGAGAIHAEADLVLTMSEVNKKGTVMIAMSARRVSVPDELFVERANFEFREVPRPVGIRQARAGKLAKALWKTFAERKPSDSMLTRADIVQRVAELGYGDLTEDNFRKTYYRRIASFVVVKKPRRGATDQNLRYRIKEDTSENKFREALGAPPSTNENE